MSGRAVIAASLIGQSLRKRSPRACRAERRRLSGPVSTRRLARIVDRARAELGRGVGAPAEPLLASFVPSPMRAPTLGNLPAPASRHRAAPKLGVRFLGPRHPQFRVPNRVPNSADLTPPT